MRETKAAIRYAKSLLSLGKEKSILADFENDFALIKSTCEENRDLQLMLKSPVVKTDKKVTILKAIFEGQVSEFTYKFIDLLCKKKREYLLGEIAKAFHELMLVNKGIVDAKITSAVALDETLKASLTAKIKGDANAVELNEVIDPSLIGGFIVRVGDKQVDASISTKLAELKRKLTDNTFIAQI